MHFRNAVIRKHYVIVYLEHFLGDTEDTKIDVIVDWMKYQFQGILVLNYYRYLVSWQYVQGLQSHTFWV